jgi:hypothetical protein
VPDGFEPLVCLRLWLLLLLLAFLFCIVLELLNSPAGAAGAVATARVLRSSPAALPPTWSILANSVSTSPPCTSLWGRSVDRLLLWMGDSTRRASAMAPADSRALTRSPAGCCGSSAPQGNGPH